MKDFWLNDELMEALIHKELGALENLSEFLNFWFSSKILVSDENLDHMSEQNREDCYIFSTHVWTTILKLRRNPQTGHILHPANRYDPIRYIIWPRREKKVTSWSVWNLANFFFQRIEAQRKFNPLKRKYLFLPIFQDQHWSLIVVVNPWKTFERLVDPDPTTEVFNMASLFTPFLAMLAHVGKMTKQFSALIPLKMAALTNYWSTKYSQKLLREP